MEKNFDISTENTSSPSSTALVIYEDKSPLIIVDDEKSESIEPKAKKKPCRTFGIISFVFSIFSLFAVMIIAVPTAFNILSPIITAISSPITVLIPLAFLIVSFLIIFVLFVSLMPAPIIGLIFATIDGNKNIQRTFLAEFGITASLVSLVTLLACMVITLIIYIIPLIISIIFEILKLTGIITGITLLIQNLF